MRPAPPAAAGRRREQLNLLRPLVIHRAGRQADYEAIGVLLEQAEPFLLADDRILRQHADAKRGLFQHGPQRFLRLPGPDQRWRKSVREHAVHQRHFPTAPAGVLFRELGIEPFLEVRPSERQTRVVGRVGSLAGLGLGQVRERLLIDPQVVARVGRAVQAAGLAQPDSVELEVSELFLGESRAFGDWLLDGRDVDDFGLHESSPWVGTDRTVAKRDVIEIGRWPDNRARQLSTC
jgi:hypothetical protein